jgi:hypothetical protein
MKRSPGQNRKKKADMNEYFRFCEERSKKVCWGSERPRIRNILTERIWDNNLVCSTTRERGESVYCSGRGMGRGEGGVEIDREEVSIQIKL